MSDEVLNPIFILCMARSGSTLLRFLLDSHPDISCPPETNFINIARAIEMSGEALKLPGCTEPARHEYSRTVVDGMIRDHLRIVQKARWCDKSLTNAQDADLLFELWPSAQFVCLYRHPMDFVHSALDACPWGFRGYGFETFVQGHETDFVPALIQYWMTHAQAMLTFSKKHPERTCSLRYEDFVSAPKITAEGLSEFLEAEGLAERIGSMFSSPHDRDGPADYKIWGRGEIDTESVGAGVQIPAQAIPRPLQVKLNEVLAELDYSPVDDLWGRIELPPHDAESPTENEPVGVIGSAERLGQQDDSMIRLVISEGMSVRWARTLGLDDGLAREEDRAVGALRPAVVLELATLRDLLEGRFSLATAARKELIRTYPAVEEAREESVPVDHKQLNRAFQRYLDRVGEFVSLEGSSLLQTLEPLS